MERSTKHRILGILVVVALVIISLPLFQGSKETNTQTAAINTPAFPDQSVQVAPPTQPAMATNNPVEPKPAPTSAAVESPEDQPDDVITTLHPSVVNAQEPAKPETVAPQAMTAANAPVAAPPVGVTATTEPKVETSNVIPVGQALATKASVKPANLITSKDAQKAKVLHASNTAKLKKASTMTRLANANAKHNVKVKPFAPVAHTALQDNGLVSLRSASYVIQMGSFKNKTNALKLVNQLRANGYPAFIQKMSTAFGENIRVFVGPANKRTAAVALADKLENHMHLKGIVISYQPLTL